MTRPVADDPVSPFNAALHTYIASYFGTSHLYASWYYGVGMLGMPINQVAAGTTLNPITYSIYDADSDHGPVPYGPSTSIEPWPFDHTGGPFIQGTVALTNGSPTVTGSGTSFSTQVVVADQYLFGASTTTRYTVLTINSDTSITLTASYAGTTASGVQMWGPFNRPPREADFTAAGYIDCRILALMAGAGSNPPTMLYEDYGTVSNDGGATWYAEGGFKFNLVTGAQRADGLTSTCASGTPCMPFLARYDEAASGTINHPIRGIISTGLNLTNQCIWPALHAPNGGYPDYTLGLLPMGARLRLNAAWWAANQDTWPSAYRNGFSPIMKAICQAMVTYGILVTDLSSGISFQIDGSQDSRWVQTDPHEIYSLMSIPTTAFELVDTIKPQYTFKASSTIGTTGTPITLTIAYDGGDNTNFSCGPHLYWTTDVASINNQDSSYWHQTGFSASQVSISNSSPTVSATWTPPGAGNYMLICWIGGQGIWWIPAPHISVAISVSSRAMTTSQDGRWDDPATWGNAMPPTAGDLATVAHALRMVGDVTLGTGAAITCLTVATGTLTVVGCKLTLRGNATIGQTSGTQATASPLTVLSSAGNPAGIEFDGNSGVTPTMSMDNDTLITVTGTAAAHAFLRTKTGTTGNPGIITGIGSSRSWFANFNWCDITNLGTASTAGITASHVSTSSNLAHPPWIMSNCTVTGCGQLPVLSIQDGGVNCQLTNTTWSNPADTSNWFCLALSVSGAITSGTRLIHNCTFLGSAPQIVNVQGFTITQNWFDPYLLGGKQVPQWAEFDGNFMHMTTNYEIQMGGGWSNCFWLHDPPTANLWPTVLMGQYTSCACTGNVYQSLTTSGGGGNCMSAGEGVPTTRTLSRTNNIILPNSGGDQSAVVVNADHNVPDIPNCANDTADHNTVYMGTGVGAVAGFTTKPCIPGFFSSFMNNLFWTNTPQSPPTQYAGYILSCQESNPYSYADPIPATSCDYNAAWGAATVPPGTWTSGAPAANGTLYNIPMTATPGAHDIILGSAPPFVDPARNIQKWAVDNGYAAPGDSDATKVTKAIAAIKANLALTKTSLLPYIRAGFTLTGSGSLINSGSDGFNRGYDPRATS